MLFKELFIPTSRNKYEPYVIGKSALTLYTLLLFLFNVGFDLFVKPVSQVQASSITAHNVISLTNKERESYGLQALKTDPLLTAAAHAKASNMFQQNYWDHFGPNGETPWQFISDAGYVYIYAGENLAKGFSTSEGTSQAWMASPKHRENILNAKYHDIGVAVVNGILQGESTTLVVQLFGSTKEDLDSVVLTKPSDKTPVYTGSVNSEKGDIKSISIEHPQEGDITNDPALDVEGRVIFKDGRDGRYSVELTEGSGLIGSVESDKSDWSIDKQSDWSEGEHTVTAEVTDGISHFTSTVSFMVDSRPPQYVQNSISTSYDSASDSWNVRFLIQEENVTGIITTKAHSYPMRVDDDGYMSASIPGWVITTGENVILILADNLGNLFEQDITTLFYKDSAKLGGVLNSSSFLPGFLNGFDGKAQVNILFSLFLLFALVVQVYYLKKFGKLHDKGSYLFTVGIWGILIVVGVVTGVAGSIL